MQNNIKIQCSLPFTHKNGQYAISFCCFPLCPLYNSFLCFLDDQLPCQGATWAFFRALLCSGIFCLVFFFLPPWRSATESSLFLIYHTCCIIYPIKVWRDLKFKGITCKSRSFMSNKWASDSSGMYWTRYSNEMSWFENSRPFFDRHK